MSETARFAVGDLVHHKLFGYRGVVVDVDARFMLSDEWYENVARSRPPKDNPWYHLLVHNATHNTYVAERNLQADIWLLVSLHLEPLFSHLQKKSLIPWLLGQFS